MGRSSRQEALEWAAHVRAVREAVTTLLSSGGATLGEVLDDRGDPAVGAVHLLTVLEALPGARKVDTRRRLAELGLPEREPIAGLDSAAVALVRAEFPRAAGVGGVR